MSLSLLNLTIIGTNIQVSEFEYHVLNFELRCFLDNGNNELKACGPHEYRFWKLQEIVYDRLQSLRHYENLTLI